MNKIKKTLKKGFTLVELVVVIAIIAILGAVSVVGYLGFVDNAKQSAADTEATQIKTVLIAGAADKDSFIELGDVTSGKRGLLVDVAGYESKNSPITSDVEIALAYYYLMTETEESSRFTLVECDSTGETITDKNGEIEFLKYTITDTAKSSIISFAE